MKRPLNAYLAKLQMQNRLSLLVEGDSDRSVLTQFFRITRRSVNESRELLIDITEDVEFPPQLPGRWEQVEHIADCVRNDKSLASRDIFRALADRDFRDFEHSPEISDKLNCHYASKPLCWTRGHSLENYLLTADIARSYLTEHFDVLNDKYLDLVQQHYGSILRQSALASIALHKAELGKTLEGALDLSVWTTTSSAAGVRFDDKAIERIAASRAICSTQISAFATVLQALKTAKLDPACDERWIGHGKNTMRLVWSGIGALLQSSGLDTSLCTKIAMGDIKGRRRSCAGSWARAFDPTSDSHPQELVEWSANARLVTGESP